jgi:hypothetical protein
MNEEIIREEIQRLLANAGIWYYHPPDFEAEKHGKGRPDIMCLNIPVVIECKRIEPKVEIEPWFDPAKISDAQRVWLDMYVYEAGYHAYIGIGTIEIPRRTWLISWRDWVDMEKKLGEKELNFRITITDLELFVDEELTRITGGWELKPYHPLLAVAPVNGHPPLSYWNKQQYSFRFGKGEANGKIRTSRSRNTKERKDQRGNT